MTYATADIRKTVTRLLREAGIQSPPVDVKRVASALSVDIVEDELDEDMSGFLVVTQRVGKIGVNRDHHPNRKRFTIAHELGHYLLHTQGEEDTLFVDRKIFNRNKDASAGVYREEIEANRFAAEILMPRTMVMAAWEEEGGDIDLSDDFTIYRLSKKFRVSEQALTYRLISLRLLPPV